MFVPCCASCPCCLFELAWLTCSSLRRLAKDHAHQSASRATLDYDDQEGYDDRGHSHYGGSYDGTGDRDTHSSRNARYDGGRSPTGGGRYSDSHQDGSRSRRPYGTPAKAIILEDVPEDATERDVSRPLTLCFPSRH
jgi:hypothetical protein